MTPIGDGQVFDALDIFRPGHSLVQVFYNCDECERANIGAAVVPNDQLRYSSAIKIMDRLSRSDAMTWLPTSPTGKDFPDVPPHIGDPASEAYTCRSVDAFKAAILMARAVVEATAKFHGIRKGQLADKIDTMFERKLISELIRDSAHEIRHVGNDMAHGDFAEPQAEGDESPPTAIVVTAQDADEVLALMDMVLDEVFQKPARVQKIRDAREAKTSPR